MYLLYGAGSVGEYYVAKCKESNITDIEITDSNPSLWGTLLDGYTIISPKDAFQRDYKYIIITAESKAYNQIKPQIEGCVKDTPIVSYGRTVVWNDQCSYDMGNMKLIEPLSTGIYLLEDFASKIVNETLNDLEKFAIWGKHTRLDKWMHYYEAYDRAFSKYRNRPVSILEIGVRGGGSMQMWRDYFSKNGMDVTVYGIDIDPGCKEHESEKMKIFIGSQEDKEFLEKVKKEIGKMDVIIDDGGHTMNQQIVSLETLWDCLKDDGTYLCEDTCTSYLAEFGGKYKGSNTFIEYSKNLIDYIHAEDSETDELQTNHWFEEVKSLSYYNGMVFIEKSSRKNRKYNWIIEEGE